MIYMFDLICTSKGKYFLGSVHAQIYQKRVDEQMKSTFELSNPEFSINTSEMDTNQSTVSYSC